MLIVVIVMILLVAILDTSSFMLDEKTERLLYVIEDEDNFEEYEDVKGNKDKTLDEESLVSLDEDFDILFSDRDKPKAATEEEVLETIRQIYTK